MDRVEKGLERGISTGCFSGELPAYQHVAGGVFMVKKYISGRQGGRGGERDREGEREGERVR